MRSRVPRSRQLLRAVSKRVIVNMLNDDFLVKKIGTDLVTSIPVKLARRGIISTVTVAYQQSAYICLEVNIGPISARRFFEVNESPISSKYNRFMDALAWTSLESIINRLFTNIIGKRMFLSIPKMTVDKLELKLYAKTEMFACLPEEQGPFMIQTIRELNDKVKQES